MSSPQAVVIGAGIGGLSAAIDLAARGLPVTLLESAAQAGGKMRELEVQGRSIDSGPTVLTMPWIFEELFTDAGSELSDHLTLQPADILARHAWPDGSRLDLFADIERSAQAISQLAGSAEAQRYRAFCEQARQVYRTLYQPFMRSQRPSPMSLITASGWRGLIDLWRIRPFQSMWSRLGRQFRDPRLRGLFARYATYCGSSPLRAPATLILVAHVEQCGVWQVDGGMQRLAEALRSLFERLGGTVRSDCSVNDIDLSGGRVAGVTLANGDHLPADVVVANADAAAIGAGKLGRTAASAVPPLKFTQRSFSAVTWSLLARTSGFDLDHHNVFFPADYPREFTEIFDQARLPDCPAVYVCAQDRGPAGCDRRNSETGESERLFLIANAPATGDRERFDSRAIESLESAVFELLQDCGLNLKIRPEHSVVTTPADFEQRFPGTGGALYGMSAHGWRASFSRPGARSRIPGLYLAGGSIHPGPGIPMVAISGRLAADAVAADLGLAKPHPTRGR